MCCTAVKSTVSCVAGVRRCEPLSSEKERFRFAVRDACDGGLSGYASEWPCYARNSMFEARNRVQRRGVWPVRSELGVHDAYFGHGNAVFCDCHGVPEGHAGTHPLVASGDGRGCASDSLHRVITMSPMMGHGLTNNPVCGRCGEFRGAAQQCQLAMHPLRAWS